MWNSTDKWQQTSMWYQQTSEKKEEKKYMALTNKWHATDKWGKKST